MKLNNVLKGITMAGAAVGAVTMLPVAGTIGTISVTGAAISGSVGFITGIFMDENGEKDVKKTNEYRLVCEDLLGNLVLSSTKETEVYYMFNYVYGKLELMNDNKSAVLDREKFMDQSIYYDLKYDKRGSEKYNELKNEAAEYLYTLFVGYTKMVKDNKKESRENLKVLQANVNKIAEILL